MAIWFHRLKPGLVRLRAHRNSRVQVPDLADTVGPVTESNCIGAIPPGGEQLNVNHQSVTPSVRRAGQSELDSVGGSGEPASQRRSPNKIVRPALREWSASGRGPQMVGDRMVGSSGDVNQGTTAGDDPRACRGQSVRSSQETSNDRGAKGRRKAVPAEGPRPSHKGRRSAARLSASEQAYPAWPRSLDEQWAARNWVSGFPRTARLVCSLRASRSIDLSQPIDGCRLESRMREIRLSGLGGRGSDIRSSYPHRAKNRFALVLVRGGAFRSRVRSGTVPREEQSALPLFSSVCQARGGVWVIRESPIRSQTRIATRFIDLSQRPRQRWPVVVSVKLEVSAFVESL